MEAAVKAPSFPPPPGPEPDAVTEPLHPREPDGITAPFPPREASVAIQLPAGKAPSPSPPPAPVDEGAASGRWVVILLLLVVGGIAAYVLFDGFLRPLGR